LLSNMLLTPGDVVIGPGELVEERSLRHAVLISIVRLETLRRRASSCADLRRISSALKGN